jgi:hypothetical protein
MTPAMANTKTHKSIFDRSTSISSSHPSSDSSYHL